MKHFFYSSISSWLGMVLLAQVSASAWAAEKNNLPPPDARTLRCIQGWNVRVDDRLFVSPNDTLGTRVLSLLEAKLVDITFVVPSEPLKKLQAVTIVLDLAHGSLHNMQYHPSADWLQGHGYATNLVKCVHIPEAKDLLKSRSINEQPWVVLHELSHAYHDQVLGFDESRILRTFENYKKSGHGDNTLLYNGTRVRHYGLTDQKEFFAEMTESDCGRDDCFPFNAAELMRAEPEIFELMKAIWGPLAFDRTGRSVKHVSVSP